MLENNNGLKSMFTIRNILNDNNVDEDFQNITPGEVTKFKYAKITSCMSNGVLVNIRIY